MSKVRNCICMTCDRCGHTSYYDSDLQIDNVGWGCDVKIDTENPVDLCAKCYSEFGTLIQGFLYHKTFTYIKE